jgi:hypothetical protein
MDAMRSDGTQVVLKRYDKPPGAAFEPFFTAFCAQRSDGAHPHNHNTPIYEVLQPPSNENLMFLVLPRLRTCNDPAFDTIGEAVAFFQHLFEVRVYPRVASSSADSWTCCRVSHICTAST